MFTTQLHHHFIQQHSVNVWDLRRLEVYKLQIVAPFLHNTRLTVWEWLCMLLKNCYINCSALLLPSQVCKPPMPCALMHLIPSQIPSQPFPMISLNNFDILIGRNLQNPATLAHASNQLSFLSNHLSTAYLPLGCILQPPYNHLSNLLGTTLSDKANTQGNASNHILTF